jgi:hypothetical protein
MRKPVHAMREFAERVRQIWRSVRLETVAGPEWTDGRTTVIPVARTLSVGPVWHSRPAAVIVSIDGSASRVPIRDTTRWVQLALVLAALLVLWEVWARTKTRKERS